MIGYTTPGRYCAMHNLQEETELRAGMDFRRPEYRREVFQRFYQFHLRYRSHPGGVYYLLPYLAERLGWDAEQRYWFAFLNGCCQNPLTSYALISKFPRLDWLDLEDFSSYFRRHYLRFGWDTDRRYVKNKLETCILSYLENLGGRSQADYFTQLAGSSDERLNFQRAWATVLERFDYFGRLSTFSYLEYLRILGLPIECDQLFLDDIDGSRSHRNGLCKVLGRDDLDWHPQSNPGFSGIYSPAVLAWLEQEGAVLLHEAQARSWGQPWEADCSYFTLESTLCCYKSWHRINRRYPNVYNDMLVGRIRYAEAQWAGIPDAPNFGLFWDARRQYLPPALRLEDTPADLGLHAIKQNHYRQTGQVIMMDQYDSVFTNDYNDFVGRGVPT